MKRLSSLALSFVFLIALLAVYPVKPGLAEAAVPAKKSALQTAVDAMQPGWNLGNTFDATGGGETAWGNPLTTKDLIDHIAAAGFKSIRIPVTWQERLGAAPDYAIDPAFMKRIQEVIDWSLADGLYVILNIHHDSSWIMNMETQHDDVMTRFKAIWTQVAAHFKDYPDKLMFESVNEPRFSDDWNKDSPKYFEMLDELNTTFFHIVRAAGGRNAERPLVLPTMTASASQGDRLDELLKTIDKLHDKHIIATFHYYGYWQFSVNIAGVTTFGNEARTDLVNTFDRAYDTLAVKGIPVIVGEFGLLGFDKSVNTIEHGEMLKFMEFITYYAREKSFPLMLWDNGQHYDRVANQWSDEDLYRTIMAGMKSRSSTAETDSIFLKKDAEIADASIPLNLNGNTLTAVKNGGKPLAQGTDYEIDGDRLTVKAGLLKSLETGTTGVKAILTCTFSAGADWKLSVIDYDTPAMADAEGSASGFGIPTQFFGDRLAAVEASYTDGGNTGPNDWTPYKEFNYAFAPDYATSSIQLKPEFLNEVRDGEEVTLNVHFASGEVIPYKITKQGSAVTGVSTQAGEEATETAAAGAAEAEPDDAAAKEAGAPATKAANKANEANDPKGTAANKAVAAPAQKENGPKTDRGGHAAAYATLGGVILVVLLAGGWLYMRRRADSKFKG